MPYCSSEQRLQGYEEHTVEVDNADVSDSEVTVEVSMIRPCASCGSDAARYDALAIVIPFEHECPKADEDHEPEFEIESGFDEGTPTDEYMTKDRHGKPIKNSRYQKRLLGAEVSGSIKCQLCDEVIELSGSDNVQAGEFEVESSH